MADAGLPDPPTPQAPQPPVLQQPAQPSVPPNQPIPIEPIQHIPQVNWSYFKPEFSGKPEKDAEVYLLRMNDWMDTHAFSEGVKVQ